MILIFAWIAQGLNEKGDWLKMVSNSASQKHGDIQIHVQNVIENLTLPRGWVLQKCKCEVKGDGFQPDVMAMWAKKSGSGSGKFILYVEVQKNMSEKLFNEKIERYKNMIRSKQVYSYVILEEKKCPNDIFLLDDYIYSMLELNLPW